jgi:DNA-binding transcriptional LysR family regulator
VLPSAADLGYFLEVAHTLNISRAAERLGLSQPSLSMAVQRLEQAVGAPLLIRGKAGVALSRAGQRLIPKARALLDEWERIRSEAARDEAEVGGRYVLGCHPSVAQYALPPVLPSLLASHTTLDLKLVHDLSRKVTEDVISFKVDFGIVVNPVEHPDLVIKHICSDDVMLWVKDGPAEPLQDPESGSAALIFDPELQQSQVLLKKFAKRRWHFSRTITTSSLEVVTALVAAGAGAGILPSRVAGRAVGGGLRPFEGAGGKGAAKGARDVPKYEDDICFVYRADAQRSRASRTVAQAIEAALRKGLK